MKSCRGEICKELFKVIRKNILNYHLDNWDNYRFGPEPRLTVRMRIVEEVLAWLKFFKYYFNSTGLIYFPVRTAKGDLLAFTEDLYVDLVAEGDRDLLIQILAYRIMGYRKIRLPHSSIGYWELMRRIQSMESSQDYLSIGFMDSKLPLNDLSYLGYPVKLYFSAAGIMADYVIEQYRYKGLLHTISVNEGDIVLDGGGCFGDTALYFGHRAGDKGQVFSFEFIPANIEIWKKNIQLNDTLISRIRLVEKPLWSTSDVQIYYKDRGPASKVSLEEFEGCDGYAKTTTIDEFVEQRQLERIDFIKLDVEGAELQVLMGAVNSIRNFKPKLAVAVYHSPNDFAEIPALIKGLNIGYRFWLSHSTIHHEETILFASCN